MIIGPRQRVQDAVVRPEAKGSLVHIRGLATSTETISKVFAIIHFWDFNPLPGIRPVRYFTQGPRKRSFMDDSSPAHLKARTK